MFVPRRTFIRTFFFFYEYDILIMICMYILYNIILNRRLNHLLRLRARKIINTG